MGYQRDLSGVQVNDKSDFGPVLGIETSCDETAAAIVRLCAGRPEILADVIWSQNEEHAPYGGVVPEIAARSHVEKIDLAIARAMKDSGMGFGDLAGVAATGGPGLIGGVMVGLTAGKAIALARSLPFTAINHLEGHALSPRLTGRAAFPYLLLLASGGHCQFIAVEGVGRYTRLGTTIDDAAGEAFDKAAKLLGLGFPGGPAVEAAAARGDPARFALPRPLLGKPGSDLSFAGLKTALARAADEAYGEKDRDDLAASFQATVVDVLADRTQNAIRQYEALELEGPLLVAAGGVAANQTLRARLAKTANQAGYEFLAPPQRYCTDNAAMIALAGIERLTNKFTSHLEFAPRPRWPLDEAAAVARPAHIPGRKGAKA